MAFLLFARRAFALWQEPSIHLLELTNNEEDLKLKIKLSAFCGFASDEAFRLGDLGGRTHFVAEAADTAVARCEYVPNHTSTDIAVEGRRRCGVLAR